MLGGALPVVRIRDSSKILLAFKVEYGSDLDEGDVSMLRQRAYGCAAVVLAIGFAAASAARADENDSWVGRAVLAKRPDAALKVGQKLGARAAQLPQPMRMAQEQGDWLWIEAAGTAGWLKKADVTPVDQAERFFTDLLQSEPENAWAYNLRGLVREQQGEFEAAIEDFTRAIRYDAQMASAYNNRGIALDRRGDPKRALEDYGAAIKLDPAYAAAYNNRGLAHANLGELKAAVADFDEAIRLDPKFAAALNNRGIVRDQTGDMQRAADFAAAIRLDAKFAEAHGNLGNVWRRQGKYKQAIEEFNQAVKLRRKMAPATTIWPGCGRPARKKNSATARRPCSQRRKPASWPTGSTPTGSIR